MARTSKFSPEVRERAVRMVLDNAAKHESRWQPNRSVAEKLGYPPLTLPVWVTPAGRAARFLGQTGRSILTRLLGVILAALAVQFVADGIRELMAV